MEKEPIRVLQVTTGLQAGGVQTFLLNYARNIDPKNIMFDYIVQTTNPCLYDEEVKEKGSRIYAVTPISESYIRFVRDVYRVCKEHPEDKIIHAHLNFSNLFPLFAAKLAGVSVRISHSHSHFNAISPLRALFRKGAQLCLPLYATEYWGCSKEAMQWLYGKHAASKKGKLIFNAIDVSKYAFKQVKRDVMRENLGVYEKEKVWIHVGSFNTIKNQIFLIKLFEQYCKKHPNTKLILVGDGKLRDTIRETIEKLKLNDKVIMPGVVKDVEKYMMAADLFLLPSLFEGLPLVMVEAQATGLPCVVSSAVTKEVFFSQHVCSCKDFEMNTWLQRIEKVSSIQIKREKGEKIVTEAGYDIRREAIKLVTYYEECYRK